MSIISLENKRLRVQKNKIQSSKDEELSESAKSFSKVVHMSRFLRLKQSAHWENIKLRNGLVLKIHKARQNAQILLTAFPSAETNVLLESILEIASNCADYILYSENSTMDLLNKYWECKNAVDAKVKAFTKSLM